MLIGESIPGAWHWLLLIWSIVAVTLALRLRKKASINWLGAVWLVGGMILGTLGVIGLYLGKVFEEVKGRPLYVVREVTGAVRDEADEAP
jgi:dolichol-phosphate mannosyltransferase